MTPRPRATSTRPASNCGLTSSTIGDPGWHSATSTGMTVTSEMNERSATRTSAGPPISLRCRRLDVGSLEHGHPVVVAQTRVQLTVADVEGDDVGRAVRQQAVREPAGRRADVDGPAPCDVDAELLQCGVAASRRHDRRSAPGAATTTASPGATSRDALSAVAPLTSTVPVATRSTAPRSASLASPRRTSSASRRRRATTQVGREVATLRTPEEPTAFFAVDRFAVDRFAVDRLAVDRLAVDRLAVDFLAALDAFFAVRFAVLDVFLAAVDALAAAFFAGAVLAAALLATDFLAAAAFLAVAFFAVDFFAADFLVADFFAADFLAGAHDPAHPADEALELVLEVVDAVGEPAELLGDLGLHRLGQLRRRLGGPGRAATGQSLRSRSDGRRPP